jgi:hypothetical protein
MEEHCYAECHYVNCRYAESHGATYFASYEVKNKKFYKNPTWAQCYKTFYARNLRISLKL